LVRRPNIAVRIGVGVARAVHALIIRHRGRGRSGSGQGARHRRSGRRGPCGSAGGRLGRVGDRGCFGVRRGTGRGRGGGDVGGPYHLNGIGLSVRHRRTPGQGEGPIRGGDAVQSRVIGFVRGPRAGAKVQIGHDGGAVAGYAENARTHGVIIVFRQLQGDFVIAGRHGKNVLGIAVAFVAVQLSLSVRSPRDGNSRMVGGRSRHGVTPAAAHKRLVRRPNLGEAVGHGRIRAVHPLRVGRPNRGSGRTSDVAAVGRGSRGGVFGIVEEVAGHRQQGHHRPRLVVIGSPHQLVATLDLVVHGIQKRLVCAGNHGAHARRP